MNRATALDLPTFPSPLWGGWTAKRDGWGSVVKCEGPGMIDTSPPRTSLRAVSTLPIKGREA